MIMKIHQSLAFLVSGLVPVPLFYTGGVLAQNVPEVVPHVVVVQFEAGINLSGKTATTGLQAFDRKAAAYGVHAIERVYPFLDHVDPTPKTRRNLLALRRTYYVRYMADTAPKRVAGDLATVQGVVYAEPVPVNRTQAWGTVKRVDPDDPRFGDQPELGLMRLPEAWDVVKGEEGSPRVVIAVVDGGGEWRHEDLRANVWTNEDEIPGNGIDDDVNGFIDDVHGVNFANGDDTDNDPTGLLETPGNALHGTTVAGSATAVTDNSVGVAGAAWNAELMHINAGCGSAGLDNAICYGYEGILYAATSGADIINASWSSIVRADDEAKFNDESLDLATDMGSLVVAAASNDNLSNDEYRPYPARSPRVLSVGATQKDRVGRAGFSNYGRLVNVFAPGVDILTTGSDNGYVLISGTSFSSPLTSGVAALVKTRFPAMDPDALREHIRLTSDNIDAENPGFEGQLGRGLVDALAAVQAPTSPAVRLKRWSWADDDGDRVIESGDVVTITATMVNYLSDARGLSVGLVGAEPYPFLDMAMAEMAVGFLPSGDSTEVQFEFRVATDAPDNQLVRLYTHIRDGAFEDGADQLSFRVNLSLDVIHRSLSALYTATGGDNWTQNDNWDITRVPTEEELAKWVGVGLNEGFLVGLVMGTNNLMGTLPPELENLQNLLILGLFENEGLSGPIPPELGNLGQLETLWLDGNSLTGPVPPELGNLGQLKLLSLYRNLLTGSIPPELGNLGQLERLWLDDNSLTGPIPPELGNLGQLEWLSLDQNSLTGPIPPELGNLKQLQRLSFSENSLSGSIPPEFGSLEQLRTLRLSFNTLSGPIPPELGKLEQLEELNLWGNTLTGSIPPELWKIEQLEELYLLNNSLTGSIPPELGKLEQLEELHLGNNSLTGSIPPELGNLEQLQWLDLSSNSLTGAIPPELGNLEELWVLWLDNNSLSGPIPPELGNLEHLWGLWLDNNSLSGPIPPELGNLEQLQWLHLSSNPLTGSIPPELGNLEQLQWLDLSSNSLTGPIPPELGNLSGLKRLRIDWNFLTGRLPRSLMQLDSLETFHFGNQSVCAPADDEFQMWLSRIPDHSGPTCAVAGGDFVVQYDQGEAVGTVDGSHLFFGLPADAQMATRFVVNASSGGKQWNRAISVYDREARIEVISSADQVTRLETPSSDDQKAQIEELLGNRRGRTDPASGPEEWKRLVESIGKENRERRMGELLEDKREQKRIRAKVRDLSRVGVAVSSRDEQESAGQRVSTGDREVRSPTYARGERDGRYRSSLGEDHEGRFGTSTADDEEVQIDRVWLAPYYDNQFSNTTLPTDAARDFTVYIYSDRDGVPGDVLFSKEVEDPRAYAEVTNFTLDFFELDLSTEGIGALPDTIHIAYENAGTDDNLLVLGPAPYTEKNVSHVYLQGAWQQLWDLMTTGGDSFNETVVPIRARFRTQTPLQFAQTIADQSFILGQSVTPLVLPEAIGGVSPISYSLLPALPSGLAFDASSRTISGTPTEVTTPPVTATYTAADAAGDVVSMQFGIEVHSSVGLQVEAVPSTFALRGNYPNPFTGSTRIVFDLPSAAKVSVDVSDITGRRVLRVPARMLEAGWDRGIDLSGAGLPSGMYVYWMHVGLPEGAIVKSGSFIHIR